MRKIFLLLLIVPFIASSCFKKIDEATKLNTNIFDKDYEGEQWYEITEIFQYTNDLGQIRVRMAFELPLKNLPDLKPSEISIDIDADGIASNIRDIPATSGGGFNWVIELPYAGMATSYCVNIGLSVDVDGETTAINKFAECKTL